MNTNEAIKRVGELSAMLDNNGDADDAIACRALVALLQPGDAAGMVEEAERLSAAATEGPWTLRGCVKHPEWDRGACVDLRTATGVRADSDADRALQTASRTLVPQLAAECRRLGAVVKAVEALLDRAGDYVDVENADARAWLGELRALGSAK